MREQENCFNLTGAEVPEGSILASLSDVLNLALRKQFL